MSPADRRTMMLAGPIVPTILALAAPNVLNVAMQSLVSISDSWFVSQLGIIDLAALALVFPTQIALGQMSAGAMGRSEEHTSELQSRQYLVCRLLLEKKKKQVTIALS